MNTPARQPYIQTASNNNNDDDLTIVIIIIINIGRNAMNSPTMESTVKAWPEITVNGLG